MLDRSGLVAALEAERDASAQGKIEAGSRLENLHELVGVAQEYELREEEPTLSGFLQAVSLFSEADAIEPESGRVTLMTLHNAKGLEFSSVFVLGMEQNLFPHARSIEEANLEEERRLCYVGDHAGARAADAAVRPGAHALRRARKRTCRRSSSPRSRRT